MTLENTTAPSEDKISVLINDSNVQSVITVIPIMGIFISSLLLFYSFRFKQKNQRVLRCLTSFTIAVAFAAFVIFIDQNQNDLFTTTPPTDSTVRIPMTTSFNAALFIIDIVICLEMLVLLRAFKDVKEELFKKLKKKMNMSFVFPISMEAFTVTLAVLAASADFFYSLVLKTQYFNIDEFGKRGWRHFVLKYFFI